MQGRNRSPVDGVRSGSVGMGRISPDRPFVQSQGMYGSGSRSFRRGGGGGGYRRGPPKSHSHLPPPPLPPPPPPPPRKIDILMEAGRLAAEYLVSKGVIPQASLPPKWSSNGGFQDFKGRDRDNSSFEGRTSALHRLGNYNSDVSSGRRRYSNDEYGQMGPKHQARTRRRRMGQFGGAHGSDWGRENGRNGPWMERSRSFNDNNSIEDEDDFAPGYRQDGFDDFGGGRSSRSAVDSEPPSKSEVTAESESDNCDFPDDMGSKASSSSTRKDPIPETDADLGKGMDEGQVSNMEIGEVGGKSGSDTVKKDEMEEDSAVQHNLADDDQLSRQEKDLLKLCSLTKVPRKPRSSVANRSNKADQTSASAEIGKTGDTTTIEKGKTGEIVPETEPEASVEKNSIKGSSNDTLAESTQDSICPSPEKPAILPVGCVQPIKESTVPSPVFSNETKACGRSLSFMETSSSAKRQTESSQIMSTPSFAAESKIYAKSHSFPERSSLGHQQIELSPSLPSFEVPIPDNDASMQDNFQLHCGTSEGIKRPRDWASSDLLQDDGYLNMRNLRAKQSIPPGQSLLPSKELVEANNQNKLVDAELFSKYDSESNMKMEEEKQLMPNSFKICDLNLMEAPEITEIPDDSVLDHLSGTASTMEAVNVPSVDFGLSVGHNSNNAHTYGQCSSENKVIPVINLEDDSSAEDDACNLSKPKSEAMYSNLENFLNNTENTVDLPDIQDGYGLAISDLLGADMTSCPPVPADMNSLQSGMALHGAGGIPGDDDSIYVTLGEIPISFMEVWDQPPQEYGKYF